MDENDISMDEKDISMDENNISTDENKHFAPKISWHDFLP